MFLTLLTLWGKQVELPVVRWGRSSPNFTGATKLNTRAGGNRTFPSPSLGAEVQGTLGLATPWLCLLPAVLNYGVAVKAAALFPPAVLFTVTGSGGML